MTELTRRLVELRSETEFVATDDQGADLGDAADLLKLVGYQATPSSR